MRYHAFDTRERGSHAAPPPTQNEEDQAPRLVEGFFRHEAGRLVSTLTRLFGIEHLDLSEDVVQETFMAALRGNFRGEAAVRTWLVKILVRQACYRPLTSDGLPLIGPVHEVAGAYVATGHSVWGILNAPATGEAMAELIVDGAAHTVDLEPFNPGRMPPFDPARLLTDD